MPAIDTAGLRWDELDERYPELERRELHDGVLTMSPSPPWWHQSVVTCLWKALDAWCEVNGGRTFVAPVDIVLAERRVYQPDVWLLTADHLGRLAPDGKVHAPPDFVAEVSSRSTRALDLGAKRNGYAAFGVPEYWFVDLDARAVVVHRLRDGRYPAPTVVDEREVLQAALLDGFSLSVADLLRDVPPGD